MALNLRICISRASPLKAFSFSDKNYYSYFRGKRQRGQATQMVRETELATLKFRSWDPRWLPGWGCLFLTDDGGKRRTVVRLFLPIRPAFSVPTVEDSL